ncbi:unnamed protein product [Caenorhabditis bovis]|uniref:Protein KRI1 homolog n=1 Tax=Caenorhabditis bovis TaxID=2654633 RepID=A0A8S1EX14_9PELO|nr:unnamed protein product [Caenorhabditis bovis]
MKKSKKLALFEDDGGNEEETELPINKGYAERYDNWRRLEEMQKIKDKFGDVEDDDDSSSSESEPEWTNEHEEAFLKTLGALKAGEKLESGKSFFENVEPISTKKIEKKKKDEKMTVKDYERKLILERNGKIEESDEDESEQIEHDPGYHQEQEELRKSLVAAIHTDDDEDEDVLVERKKTEKELKKDESDFLEWLKTEEEKSDKVMAKELKHLKKIWKKDDLDESEKFLRDYILNKDYDVSQSNENPTYEEIVALEEDEKEMDKNLDFERKYNFRFENPDQEFIKQYPRTVMESMRSADSKRKEKRVEREERKKKEKEEKKKELKELQKMKKSEIEEKLAKLKKAAGCDIPLSIDELNADFDPKEFDRKMQEIFNDEYYGNEEDVPENENEKPVFSDMDDSDFEDYDNLDVDELKRHNNKEIDDGEDDEEHDEPEEESVEKKAAKNEKSVMKNGKFDMISAAQKALKNDKDKDSRRKRKRNALKEALAKEKPLFDPKEKTFEEYFNEYYALDYEDIIGDQVTKFKYREVEPNTFGLTPEEILEADERQLNAWASLKKVTAYRTPQEEKFDKFAYEKKAKDVEKKKRILSTDFGGKKSLKRKAEEEELLKEAEQNSEVVGAGEGKKKKKKRGKKKAKLANGLERKEEQIAENEEEQNKNEPENVEDDSEKTVEPTTNTQKPVKKARRRNKNNVIAAKFGPGVTDSRIKAYGLNPTRFKKGLVYGS